MEAWTKLISPAQRRFRRNRAREILRIFPGIAGSVVVDLGGSLPFWRDVKDILNPAKVLIYNISSNRMEMGRRNVDGEVEAYLYDGERVPLDDNSADFVICNSVIEHVPLDKRAGLASEVRRVGRHFIVQTPSVAFPLELHFGLPFIHWLPRPLARKIVPISPFALLSSADVHTYFDETRLLSADELQSHFPDGKIKTERFMGIPKSNLVFG